MLRSTSPLALGLASLLVACGGSPAQTDDARDDRANRNVAADLPGTPPARAELSTETPSDVAAPPPDALRTPSGLASRILRAGTGVEHPGARDRVTVHYSGWRAENGRLFDSSIARGQPASFPLDRVIAGWTEGVQLMVVGEQRRLWIPTELAYAGRPGTPQGMLVFDVELISFERAPEPPQTPENVSAPPPEAQRSASGLAWVVLSPGTGTRHPSATDRVRVHYSGWRAEDGRLFDSSVARGEPITLPLDRVIAGWTEGVQLMVEGERRRFWIPSDLAYGDDGRVPGMLVFDIELLQIE